MKLFNATETNPFVKELLAEYAAPEWVLSFLGLILAFTIVMTAISLARMPTVAVLSFVISAMDAFWLPPKIVFLVESITRLV